MYVLDVFTFTLLFFTFVYYAGSLAANLSVLIRDNLTVIIYCTAEPSLELGMNK